MRAIEVGLSVAGQAFASAVGDMSVVAGVTMGTGDAMLLTRALALYYQPMDERIFIESTYRAR